ncbi:MAG TPA: ATP-binding protein [Geobacterales bacterium]|nr:ATP-binding protein [Geobacterales bacterium]
MPVGLGIRGKLFLAILLILVISYAFFIVTTILTFDATLEQKIGNELTRNLHFAHRQLDHHGELIRNTLNFPASAEPFQQHLAAKDLPWLRKTLSRWHAFLPNVEFLAVVDSSHRIVARLGGGGEGEPLDPGGVVSRSLTTKKGVLTTELVPFRYFSLSSDEELAATTVGGQVMMVTVVVPVVNQEGKLLGAIVAGDLLNRDRSFIDTVKGYSGSEVEVTICQGETKIASSLRDFVLPMTVEPEIVEELRNHGSYRGKALIGNTRYLTTFEPIVNGKDEMIGSLSVALSYEGIRHLKWVTTRNVILSASLGILLSFVIAFFVARRLSRPVREITEGARRIEYGNLEQEVVVEDHDEFGQLAASFNRMSAALRERDRTIGRNTVELQEANRRLHELNELLERKVRERTTDLQMEMGRLEAILTSMAEGVIVTGGDNLVILFNPSAQKLLSMIPHQVVGQLLNDVCTGGGICQLVGVVDEIRAAGATAKMREERVTVNGKMLRVTLTPLLDRSGGFGGVVMSLRDVTKEEELDRMKSDFISNVSHELKTPLTSIKGALQLLGRNSARDATEKELIELCERNTERLIRLIVQLLDISRLEAGGITFKLAPHNLAALANEAVAEISSLATMHGLSIVTQIANDLPLVQVDRPRLMQVLTNLLVNAVKFSHSGGSVTLSAERQQHYLAVSVADQGEVIEWSDRERLFKRFQQLDNSDQRGRQGTGLGLAICKEIIEQHHGKISYTAGAVTGNTFTFTVPIAEEG